MEHIQDFFGKIECDPDFLRKNFDNFVVAYGLIVSMGPTLSKITPVENSGNIEYILHLSPAAQLNLVNYALFKSMYDGTTVDLYGSHYQVHAFVRDADLILSIEN